MLLETRQRVTLEQALDLSIQNNLELRIARAGADEMSGLALIPLALGGGEPGKEIEAPMAIVILGGLLTSTFLNMVVVPALFLKWGIRAEKTASDS